MNYQLMETSTVDKEVGRNNRIFVKAENNTEMKNITYFYLVAKVRWFMYP